MSVLKWENASGGGKRHCCQGRRQSGWKSELLETRRHGLVLVRSARFATAPNPIVLADAAPSALLAPAPLPIVLADARPSALLARAPSPQVHPFRCIGGNDVS